MPASRRTCVQQGRPVAGCPRRLPAASPVRSRSPRSGRRPSVRPGSDITLPSGVHWYSCSRQQRDRRLDDRLILAQQPSRHPPRRAFALDGVVVVPGVVFQEVDALGESHAGVEPLGVAEGVPGAADVEEVLGRGTDQHRRRRPHHDAVGMVHAEGQLAEDVLLGVLRRRSSPAAAASS